MISPTDLHSSPSSYFKSFQTFMIYFPSVQVSTTYKVMHQTYHFTSFFLKFKSNLSVKTVFFLLSAAFAMGNPGFHIMFTTYILCYHATPESLNIPYPAAAAVFDLLCSVMGMVVLRFSLPQFFPQSFPFHIILQFQSVYESCPVVSLLLQIVAQGHLHITQYKLLFHLF